MSNIENGEKVLFETTKTLEFVRSNWTDSIGTQYSNWLEEQLESIKRMEQRREIIHLKALKIKLICDKILSDDDKPKVLTKTR